MANLYVQESYAEVGEDGEPRGMIGESGIYESFTDSPGELYKAMQAEYGRCISYCYITTKEEEARKVGWVFLKRRKYEDCDKTYLQETWVHVYTAPPTKTIEYHHARVAK